jgi:hypothetical protein
MANDESRSISSHEPPSLLVLFALVQTQIERAVTRQIETLRLDFAEVWEITAARFVPLQAFLADPVAVNGVEEQLVAAGLYGNELRLRSALFEVAASNAEISGSSKSALSAAAALLRGIDRLVDSPAAVGPVADLCDLLVAASC